ncbi:4-(cytidine 5'-diphospho)-2-C-methyl-D-erythritol kinase [Sphingobacterium hungaricum]
MISFANAKINIGLHVTDKREDGYHSIETVFYPVKLYDVIEVFESENTKAKNFGIDLSSGDNLCLKAFELLRKDFDLPNLQINLLKSIPVGAGLGGGSSDASHVLKLINTEFSLDLSDEELEKYAEKLGADCPFFIKNKAVFADGIGATFHEIDLNLTDYYIVIVYPEIHISTSEAYANVIPMTPVADLRRAIQLPIQEWKYHIINDFELGLFEKYPQLEDIKHALYEQGAIYASMTGSGSALYGIFENEQKLTELECFGKLYYPVNL